MQIQFHLRPALIVFQRVYIGLYGFHNMSIAFLNKVLTNIYKDGRNAYLTHNC